MNKIKVSAYDVCEALWLLVKSFKAHMTRIADSHGLTMMQFGALYAVSEGNITMGKVAQTMHCDASNVTGIVDRLVALDLVVRQEDPRDRRVKSLLLTPLGSTTLQRILREMPVALGCNRLSAEERSLLYGLVYKLERG